MDFLAAKWKEEEKTNSEEKPIFQYIIDLRDIPRETLQQAYPPRRTLDRPPVESKFTTIGGRYNDI